MAPRTRGTRNLLFSYLPVGEKQVHAPFVMGANDSRPGPGRHGGRFKGGEHRLRRSVLTQIARQGCCVPPLESRGRTFAHKRRRTADVEDYAEPVTERSAPGVPNPEIYKKKKRPRMLPDGARREERAE